MKGIAIGIVLFISTTLSASAQDVTQAELCKYTERAIRNGSVAFRRPNFDWSGEAVLMDLGGVVSGANTVDANDSTPWKVAVDCQFMISGIRMFRTAGAQKMFWAPVLRRAEQHVAQMLVHLNNRSIGVDVKRERVLDLQRLLFQEISGSIEALARQNGKSGLAAAAPWPRWNVTLSTSPTGGVIEYMDSGSWDLYQFLSNRESPPDGLVAPKWIAAKNPEELGGMYWFKITWPDGSLRRERSEIKMSHEGKVVIFQR